VSNIASWNYPMSVQVHAELVQALAGNAVIAKTPSQGGFHTLTLAHALMRRAGLPVTLLSGMGSHLGEVLIRSEGIGALAFVGGRANGRRAAVSLADTGRRHMLEQEGLNAWGIWEFSQWDLLARHMRKGFEYAKQRCTAYPRYVVQRRLMPAFLEAYLPVINAIKFGNPLAVEHPDDPLPDLDFGPVIHATKAAELSAQFDEAVRGGGIPLYRGSVGDGCFLEAQDTAAYVAPSCILQPPASWSLHHAEPFGPLDSVVVVDTQAELLAAMNASNGSLVASIATDDVDVAARVAEDLQAFKVGINKPRSRGDREEVFGGLGASWKGAFVGGDLLVQAVTYGPEVPTRSSSGTSRAIRASRRAEFPLPGGGRPRRRGNRTHLPYSNGRWGAGAPPAICPSKIPIEQLSFVFGRNPTNLIGVGGNGFYNVSQLPDGGRGRHHERVPAVATRSALLRPRPSPPVRPASGRVVRRHCASALGPAPGAHAKPQIKFDLASIGQTDRLVGGGTLVLFIALFLPWFSVKLRSLGSATASGLSAHGYLYITLILTIASARASGRRRLGVWKLPSTSPLSA
jgi:acyl-CoA reductase-like NAD-dependent aldehyde dehydrogenase